MFAPACSAKAEVLADGVLRALEHEVLEEVREASSPAALVFRSNVEPLVDVHDWQLAIDVQDHLKAIRQRVLLELDLRKRPRRSWTRGGRRWAGRLLLGLLPEQRNRKRQTRNEESELLHGRSSLESFEMESPHLIKHRRGRSPIPLCECAESLPREEVRSTGSSCWAIASPPASARYRS